MGMFDTVFVKCPKCCRRLGFQTKSGPCVMAEYDLSDAPEDVMSGVNRHAPQACACGEYLVVVHGLKGRKVLAVKTEIS